MKITRRNNIKQLTDSLLYLLEVHAEFRDLVIPADAKIIL